MGSKLKIALIYLGVSVLFTGVGIWLMLHGHVMFGVIWMLIYLAAVYFLANSINNVVAIVATAISFVVFVGGGSISAFVMKANYEKKAGVVYVLADVTGMRQYETSEHRSTLRYMASEAVLRTPVFGLSGLEYVDYDFYQKDSDLDAGFPIRGQYTLMRFPVALPESVDCIDINPDSNDIAKYSTPVVVTPDSTELTGRDALDYIEEYIKQNK